MLQNPDELWHLLRSLDEATAFEFPSNFSFPDAQKRLENLLERLAADFGQPAEPDRWIEDASFHADVRIPAEATATGESFTIRLSNFGNLAVITLERPGIYSQTELDELADAEDITRIATALTDLGYVVVPEEPLWGDYDGAKPAMRSLDTRYGNTWWTRYFDYL